MNNSVKRERKRFRIEKEWSDDDAQKLIDLVESNKNIWNPSNIDYKDNKLRESVFEEIAENLNRSVADCKAKWESLRAQYRSYYAKFVHQNVAVKWKHFDQMQFLNALYAAKKTDDPIRIDDNSFSSTSITDSVSQNPNLSASKHSEILSKAVTIISTKTDSNQVFGDYIADRLRQLSPQTAENLKYKMTKMILEALKFEMKDIWHDDDCN